MLKTRICAVIDIKENELNSFIIDGEQLIVFKKDTIYYVLNGTCPHHGANLAKGTLMDTTVVVCPWHHLHCDITDGSIKKGPEVTKLNFVNAAVKMVIPKVHTYETILEGADLYIKGKVVKQNVLAKSKH